MLVVLTPPAEFEGRADLEPISAEGLPACRVFYVRYRAPAQMHPLGPDMFGGRMAGPHPLGRRGPVAPGQTVRSLSINSPRR